MEDSSALCTSAVGTALEIGKWNVKCMRSEYSSGNVIHVIGGKRTCPLTNLASMCQWSERADFIVTIVDLTHPESSSLAVALRGIREIRYTVQIRPAV